MEVKSSAGNLKENYRRCLSDLKSGEVEKREEALKTLGTLLSSGYKAKELFYKFKGPRIIIHRLTLEDYRSVAQAALFALACSADGHVGNKKILHSTTLMKLLYEILQHPNVLRVPTFLNCSLILISSIASHNPEGQHLFRKNGCLRLMVLLFHGILNLADNTESEFLKESLLVSWEILCRALGANVNNPINVKNQLVIALIFPKALEYLSSLDYNCKSTKNHLHSCLNLFMLAISGNKTNQNDFAKCGGTLFLKKLIYNYECFKNEWHVLEMCLLVLDVVVTSNKFCSHEVSKTNIMPFLLKILQVDSFKKKAPVILLLCHLIQMDRENFQSFKNCKGHNVVQECMKAYSNYEDVELPAKYLLQMYYQKDLENVDSCSNKSKSTDSLIEEGINFERYNPEEIPCGNAMKSIGNASEIREVDINTSKIEGKALKLKNYGQLISPSSQSVTTSFTKTPQTNRSPLYRRNLKLNSISNLSGVSDSLHTVTKNPRIHTLPNFHSRAPRTGLKSMERVSVAHFLDSHSEIQGKQSSAEVHATCHVLSSNTNSHVNKYMESKQTMEGTVSPHQFPSTAKSDMTQARSTSFINQSKSCCLCSSNKYLMVKQSERKNPATPPLDNCTFKVPINAAKKKRSFSLTNDITPHTKSRSMCSYDVTNKDFTQESHPFSISKVYQLSVSLLSNGLEILDTTNTAETCSLNQRFQKETDIEASSPSACKTKELENGISGSQKLPKNNINITGSTGEFQINPLDLSILLGDVNNINTETPPSTESLIAILTPSKKSESQKLDIPPGNMTKHQNNTNGSGVTAGNQSIPLDLSNSFGEVNAVNFYSHLSLDGLATAASSPVINGSQAPGGKISQQSFKSSSLVDHCSAKTMMHTETSSQVWMNEDFKGRNESPQAKINTSIPAFISPLDPSQSPDNVNIKDSPFCLNAEVPKTKNSSLIEFGPHTSTKLISPGYFHILPITPHFGITNRLNTSDTNHSFNHVIDKVPSIKNGTPEVGNKLHPNNCETLLNKSVPYTSKKHESQLSDSTCLVNGDMSDLEITTGKVLYPSTPLNNMSLDVSKTAVDAELSSASDLNENNEEVIGEVSSISRGLKRVLSIEKKRIKHIPLSVKEIQNLKAGIRKFGLHFGAIRKSYSFMPMRTSKDLYLAWRDLKHIIRHPSDHEVNEHMLGVSSDEELLSE